MKLKHLGKLFFIVLLTGPKVANAIPATVDTCEYDIGVDISSVANGATFWNFKLERDEDIPKISSAVISEPQSDYSYNLGDGCEDRALGKSTFNLIEPFVALEYPQYSHFSTFSGLLVKFDNIQSNVFLNAYSGSGDYLLAFFFDANGEYLGYDGGLGERNLPCTLYGSPSICFDYSLDLNPQIGAPFSYAFFGSESSAIWVQRLTYSVPEPSTLVMLGAGFIGISFFRRRKKC